MKWNELQFYQPTPISDELCYLLAGWLMPSPQHPSPPRISRLQPTNKRSTGTRRQTRSRRTHRQAEQRCRRDSGQTSGAKAGTPVEFRVNCLLPRMRSVKMGVEIKSVLIADAVDQQCINVLQSHGISVTNKNKLSLQQLLQEIKSHDALVVRSATQVTKEVLEAAGRLKVVGRAGAGVDNIDVDAATKQNVLVLNAPGANALSACEMTCALLLSVARHVPPAATALREGRWDRALYTGTELYGKTLAVLGLGRVGREVATRMHAFGMKIIGFDPIVNAEECQSFNTTKMDLENIWPVADYITLHTPLLRSTRNLLNRDVFKKCKKGVKVINVGRGGLIDEQALLDSLNDGLVGGAALDVFETEPPTEELTLKLIQHPSVIATPHLGASTKEAQVRVGVEIAEQFVNLVKPGTYATQMAAVNKVQ